MKIVLGEVDAASVLSDKRVRMAEFPAWFIELEARAAGQPYSRDSFMIERGRELIEPGDALSALGK
jgi:hypothetical protein